MASLSSVGETVTLSMKHRGDTAAVALSGTYNMTIRLQREVGAPGSGAWETLKSWDTANATVAFNHVTEKDNENLRLIVAVDTSGTVVATLTDSTDLLLSEKRDLAGVFMRRYQDGVVFYNQDGDTILDTRLSQQIINITDANYTVLAANSGKIHSVANVSADRTFTLPTAQDGLNYSFRAEVGAADGHDWIFAAADTADLFKGGVLMVDTDAGPATVAAVVGDQSNDDAFQVNLPQGGTRVDMYCDGTYWIVSGIVMSATAAAFS